MRTRESRDESGIVAVNLVLVIAFALFAVIMLTRTTVAASSIDDRVEKIRSEVSTVDEELSNVPQLDQTAATAAEIDTATKNLSRQAGEIVTAAQSIDRTVSAILSNATSINSTVGSIQSSLGGIQPVVRSIDGGALGSRVGAAGINTRVAEVRRLVGAIRSDTISVLQQVGPGAPFTIHGHANSIDCHGVLKIVSGTNCDGHR